MSYSVFVAGCYSTDHMFTHRGWTVVNELEKADLFVLTGGSDISPELYGEENKGLSYCNPSRDKREVELYKRAKSINLPVMGICRGLQLINALNGGFLLQDISGHAGRNHTFLDPETNETITTTSVHHQMCVPPASAVILGLSRLDGCQKTLPQDKARHSLVPDFEPEAIYYPDSGDGGVQGHPEYGSGSIEQYFFDILTRKFNFMQT